MTSEWAKIGLLDLQDSPVCQRQDVLLLCFKNAAKKHQIGIAPWSIARIGLRFEETNASVNLMEPNRFIRAYRAILVTTLISWIAAVSGCACRPCSVCPSSPVEPSYPESLPQVDIGSRTPISLSRLDASFEGMPVLDTETQSLRELAFSECERIAAKHSAVAKGLRQERSVIAASKAPHPALLNVIDAQIVYQRNVAAGDAMEAFLNLANVHLQHPLVVKSERQIDRVRRILEQLRENEIPPGFDVREIDRRELEIQEKKVDLLFNQRRVTALLEQLLELEPSREFPLWTAGGRLAESESLEIEQLYETALANRVDIASLETLAGQCDSELLEAMRRAASGVNPLLGMAIFGGGPLEALFCRQQDQSVEMSRRKQQLYQLAQTQKKMLRLEIEQVVASMKKRIAMIESKKKIIESYQLSIEEAEKIKDLKQVDLKEEFTNQLQIIATQSALIDEAVGYEIDRVRLYKSMGLLAR